MGRSEMEPSGSNGSSPTFSWLATSKTKDGSQDSYAFPPWAQGKKQNPETLLVAELGTPGSGLTWPVILEERFSFMEEMSLVPLSLWLGLCGWRQFASEGELGQYLRAT